EDDHPWITGHPRGMLVVAILRRIVFTLLAIYRAITQRSDERRQMPWKLLLEEIWTVLITALALMPAASVERPPIRLQRPTTRTRPRGPPIKGARARRGA
ncbi:MAG: hypothetical protein KF718_29670, partial [Polyangiaceae bacterium]|nr:hypothetical protein [Polyangiaceae bacterium]